MEDIEEVVNVDRLDKRKLILVVKHFAEATRKMIIAGLRKNHNNNTNEIIEITNRDNSVIKYLRSNAYKTLVGNLISTITHFNTEEPSGMDILEQTISRFHLVLRHQLESSDADFTVENIKIGLIEFYTHYHDNIDFLSVFEQSSYASVFLSMPIVFCIERDRQAEKFLLRILPKIYRLVKFNIYAITFVLKYKIHTDIVNSREIVVSPEQSDLFRTYITMNMSLYLLAYFHANVSVQNTFQLFYDILLIFQELHFAFNMFDFLYTMAGFISKNQMVLNRDYREYFQFFAERLELVLNDVSITNAIYNFPLMLYTQVMSGLTLDPNTELRDAIGLIVRYMVYQNILEHLSSETIREVLTQDLIEHILQRDNVTNDEVEYIYRKILES